MKKNDLARLVKKRKSTREISGELGKSQTAIRYWLKKHGLETDPQKPVIYNCPCGETKSKNFYGRKTRICKTCHNQYTIQKGQEKKAKGVELLGGKCQSCGYHKCIQALEFHHTDPKKKDVNFVSFRGWSWERIKKELKACELLCSNCHAEIHA